MRRVIIESPEKQCSKCKTMKSADAFSMDKNRSDGKHPWCKACVRVLQEKRRRDPEVREAQRRYQREWSQQPKARKKNADYQRSEAGKETKLRIKWKAKYGLTPADVEAMMVRQNRTCAVCRDGFASSKHTHIDHCHRTGRVRGILCHNCNRALGAVRDRVDVLRGLIAYLMRSGSCAA